MTTVTPPQSPVVVLAGFMGVGKTEVGQALANILGVEFIDTDAAVEAEAGMSVFEIFERHGEGHFRDLESQICLELAPENGAVIAVGGGILNEDVNFDHLSSLGTMVLLEATVDAIVERLQRTSSRPLLPGRAARQDDDGTNEVDLKSRVEALMAERLPAYHQISFRVDTTGRSSAEVTAEIASLLEKPYHVISLAVDVRPLPGRAADETLTSYEGLSRIVVGRGVCNRLGSFLDQLGLRSGVFLLTPDHLRERFVECIKPSLDETSIPCRVLAVEDGDDNKTLAQISVLLDQLAGAGANRDNVIVNVGGGVTGDLGGLVAAMYMRGLPFVQIPTTLLAQVDASVGGKVGVNHPRAKNLIGSFYQPHLVLCDPLMLDGLPLPELVNGMAEAVKTAIIGSRELYDSLYERFESAPGGATEAELRDPVFLERCVLDCARVKCEIVEQDPYERDLRRVLNLGHTLGHALEAALGYKSLRHGEAVALGTVAAIRVAMARNRASKLFLDKTISILKWCGLPTKTPPVDRGAVRDALVLDKKRKSGRIRFVLPLAPGEVEIISDAGEDELLDALLT